VLRPHGLRGEVRVEIHTDAPEWFALYKRLYLAPVGPDGSALMSGTPLPRALQEYRFHQEKVLLKLEGVDDRTQAEMLRDQWVWISIEDAVPLQEGEVYLHDMLRMHVVSSEGEPLGEVTEVIETGANYVYVVHGARGEILLPDTPEVVLDIDTEARRMTVHLIDGLL